MIDRVAAVLRRASRPRGLPSVPASVDRRVSQPERVAPAPGTTAH